MTTTEETMMENKKLGMPLSAWCAHTMTAKYEEILVCCDCGRNFKGRGEVEIVQEYEERTGLVMPDQMKET